MNKITPVWDAMFREIVLDCRRTVLDYLAVDEEIRFDPDFPNGFLMYREYNFIHEGFYEET